MSRQLSLGLVACMVASLMPAVQCYPTGPPVNATNPTLCQSMEPSHGVAVQTTTSPFEIHIPSNCYKPGQDVPVYVRLTGDNASEPYYEGLFVMARKKNNGALNRTTNYGTFTNNGDSELQGLPCFDKQNSALGQTINHHWKCKKFLFQADADETEDLYIHATVVRNTEKFWMNLESHALKYNDTCAVPGDVPCIITDAKTGSTGTGAAGFIHATFINALSAFMLIIVRVF